MMKAMGIFASKLSGQTLTFTTRRTAKGTSGITSPEDGTITDATTATSLSKWDDLGTGIEGSSIQPSIFGTIPGGTYIYQVLAEVQPTQKRYQRT